MKKMSNKLKIYKIIDKDENMVELENFNTNEHFTNTLTSNIGDKVTTFLKDKNIIKNRSNSSVNIENTSRIGKKFNSVKHFQLLKSKLGTLSQHNLFKLKQRLLSLYSNGKKIFFQIIKGQLRVILNKIIFHNGKKLLQSLLKSHINKYYNIKGFKMFYSILNA
jgi:hypothetical protein